MIVLENTAGSGQGLGFSFEQLAAMREGVEDRTRVGICLDTAHLFAAGFAIHTEDGLEETLTQFNQIIGMEHLKVVHLNDSKAAFKRRVDRHWHIGQGHIGLEAFRRIVNHPKLQHLPFILETPKKTEGDDPRNLAAVRKLTVDVAQHPQPERPRHVRDA
jgi:deoxyribonuclease-4